VVWPLEKGRIIRVPLHPVENELAEQSSFSTRLIAWQKQAGRHDLPWQQTRDPYRVWLSEIMLQQTQVTTVIPYYQRFLTRFPDLAALAAAPIEAVIEHWAGLGYYARARNLHRCAQQIVTVNAGIWPKSVEQLAELPGIGRSTAAAIAAFAFGQRAAILDGNVKRVLCRHFAIDDFPAQAAVDRKLWALANDLLPAGDIEAYTQGLMDLGATLCTRSRPDCQRCPLAASCMARQQGRQAELPVAKPRAVKPERRSSFVMISDGQRILLERRPPSGIWGGLLVPPEGEASTVLANLGLTLESATAMPPLRHTFTHFHLTLEPIFCLVSPTCNAAEAGMEWVELAKASTAGVPTPIRKLFKQVASVMG
jgi:A/G-specific adenine glycosylase